MRRLLMLAVVGSAGCSNAPIAGFLDTVAPCKAPVPERPEGRPPGTTIIPGEPIPTRPRDPGTLPPATEFIPPVGPRN